MLPSQIYLAIFFCYAGERQTYMSAVLFLIMMFWNVTTTQPNMKISIRTRTHDSVLFFVFLSLVCRPETQWGLDSHYNIST